jgi:hypothetical protein
MIYDQIFSTRDINNGDLRYRIEVQMVAPYRYMQRHIWLTGNAPCGVAHVGADAWIPSLKCCFDSVRTQAGAYEVSDIIPALESRLDAARA